MTWPSMRKLARGLVLCFALLCQILQVQQFQQTSFLQLLWSHPAINLKFIIKSYQQSVFEEKEDMKKISHEARYDLRKNLLCKLLLS